MTTTYSWNWRSRVTSYSHRIRNPVRHYRMPLAKSLVGLLGWKTILRMRRVTDSQIFTRPEP